MTTPQTDAIVHASKWRDDIAMKDQKRLLTESWVFILATTVSFSAAIFLAVTGTMLGYWGALMFGVFAAFMWRGALDCRSQILRACLADRRAKHDTELVLIRSQINRRATGGESGGTSSPPVEFPGRFTRGRVS
jgi:hypothetical protein